VKAIRVNKNGGPEQLVLEDLTLNLPGPREALVRVAFAGVNLYDTQIRSGHALRPLPLTPGLEGSGTIEAVGPGVDLAVGTRVAWALVPGAYATHAIVPVDRLVALPAATSLETAAALLFQGLTAHHLATSTFPLAAGHVCVVHSAAGGVGTMLCQIAKRRGARVIGAVSTDAKAAIARECGAEAVVVYGRDDLKARAHELSGGRGADVVYDAVGKETFAASLDALRSRGYLCVYGEASGFVPPFNLTDLSKRGSLFVTRTSMNHYVATREEYLQRANELFDWVADGSVVPRIREIYPLARAAAAHQALEGRETTGKLLIACS
jgi:NADPH:quinone reductase